MKTIVVKEIFDSLSSLFLFLRECCDNLIINSNLSGNFNDICLQQEANDIITQVIG